MGAYLLRSKSVTYRPRTSIDKKQNVMLDRGGSRALAYGPEGACRESAMVPEKIATFLDGATVGFGATRDGKLVPQVYFVVGWSCAEDRQAITCLFPAGRDEKLISSLEDNGQFSFTVLGSTSGPRASNPPNPGVDFHECYQFKGDYVASRPGNEGDLPLVRRKGEQFKALFQPLFGFSERACTARFRRPVLAVTFKVREIYDQTPGPGAGARIREEEG